MLRAHAATLALATAGAVGLAMAMAPRGARQAATPPPMPGGPPPREAIPQTLFCGIWRTDGGFMSDIKLQNALQVAPIAVTVTLYMADGTAYILAPVSIAPMGAADVNINMALQGAPPSLGGHISQFGSASYTYLWDSPGHVPGVTTMMDAARSLVFEQQFFAQTPPPPAPSQIGLSPGVIRWERGREQGQNDASEMQAVWWKHDADDSGLLTLANTTGQSTSARYRLTGALGSSEGWQQVEIAPYALVTVPLDRQIEELPRPERDHGGLDVEGDAVNAWAGFENPAIGYSADLDFVPSAASMDMQSTWSAGGTNATGPTSSPMSTPGPVALGAAGIMVGRPMPNAGFPEATYFSPYAYLRNTSSRPLDLSVRLSLSSETGPGAGLPLRPIRLAPRASTRLDLGSYLPLLIRPSTEGAMLNWSVSYVGLMGDLDVATGSVDETGTYVFAVTAQREGPSAGQLIPMWSLASGDDTMISLWNQSSSAQDLELSFATADGAGQYVLPVHLAPQTSLNVDLAQLVASGQPDEQGRGFPPGALTGSAMLMPVRSGKVSKRGMLMVPKSGFWAMNDIVVSTGVFNARTATCCQSCTWCCGYSNPGTFVDGVDAAALGNVFFEYMTLEDVGGNFLDCTENAVWKSLQGLASYQGIVGSEAEFLANTAGTDSIQADALANLPPGHKGQCICGCYSGDLIAANPIPYSPPDQCNDPTVPTAVSRGALIAEYAAYGVTVVSPGCSDFTSASGTAADSGLLTPSDEFAWALIGLPISHQHAAGIGYDVWMSDYATISGDSSSHAVDSGYRTPAHNHSIGGATQSAHMAGVAVDVANNSKTMGEYDSFQTAAISAGAFYVEPTSGPCLLNCSHADWRTSTYSYTGGFAH